MTIRLAVIASTASLGFAVVFAAADTPPDLILLHGRIHTEDANRSVAQPLAIRGNKIIAVGTDQMVDALKGRWIWRPEWCDRPVRPA
jgi:hypothetical protein